MKILPLVRVELARLTSSRLSIAALIALMIVPVIYGGLYLWGNQDPYSNLDNVPAALVVDDAGTTVDGKPVNYGADTAKQLLDDEKFGWVRTTEAQAQAGVRNGTFDFAVTFPASFSKNLSSAASTSPVAARIGLITNDTNSYLSTTIAKQGAEAVRVALAQKVGAAASQALLGAVANLRSGLVDARDGATQLADGATSAASGAASLARGLAQLDSGAAALPGATARLSAGASQVAVGAKQLSAAAPAAASGAKSAAAGAKSLNAGLSQLAASTPGIRQDLVATLASSNLSAADQQRLVGEFDAVSGGVSASRSGAASLASGLSTLSGKLGALPGSASRLASGASQVASGAKELAGATPALASGIRSAATGASSLSTGLTKLDDGAGTLKNSLDRGIAQVPATTASERALAAATIADPVSVNQVALTAAQNYGAGLAPFFISLAGWIGIYALFLLVRPISRRALTAVRRPLRTVLAGWATPATLGVLQMAALFALITLGLHLQIANPLGLLGFMALASITFAAIILALNVLFGSVGQFLGLLLMVVQLVTAGGTFPWQTLPAPLAFIHQALPMSHAVEGVRQLMYSGSTNDVAGPILWLVGWLVASLAIATAGARKQGRFRALRELRPSPIGG